MAPSCPAQAPEVLLVVVVLELVEPPVSPPPVPSGRSGKETAHAPTASAVTVRTRARSLTTIPPGSMSHPRAGVRCRRARSPLPCLGGALAHDRVRGGAGCEGGTRRFQVAGGECGPPLLEEGLGHRRLGARGGAEQEPREQEGSPAPYVHAVAHQRRHEAAGGRGRSRRFAGVRAVIPSPPSPMDSLHRPPRHDR